MQYDPLLTDSDVLKPHQNTMMWVVIFLLLMGTLTFMLTCPKLKLSGITVAPFEPRPQTSQQLFLHINH